MHVQVAKNFVVLRPADNTLSVEMKFAETSTENENRATTM